MKNILVTGCAGFIGSLLLWLLGYTGLLYLTKSFQNSKVNIIAPLKYLEVIFTIIIGVCFFGERYTKYSLLVVFLILIGVILNTLLKNRIKTSKKH